MPASLPFSQAFDFASGVIGDRFQNPFWKVKESIFGGRFRRSRLEVKSFGQRLVSSAVSKRVTTNPCVQRAKQESYPMKNNLINSLLDHIPNHQVVADAAMNYLSAGRDTTAQSLTWTLYLLIRHPQHQKALLHELHSIFPSAVRGSALNDVLYEKIQPVLLPYMHAVFAEALRLYPPVPFELKECTSDSTFPDGTWLPQGSVVLWVPWAMGRSHDIWGSDCEEFKPRRWLTNPDTTPHIGLQKSAFEFPVFNGGPRSCLGKKLAEILAAAVLARLIWRYDFEEVIDPKLGGCGEGGERISQNSLTLPMEGGLPTRVNLRSRKTQ